MLDHQDRPFHSKLIGDYSQTIVLPPSIQSELSERGIVGTCDEEVRVVSRFRCNGPIVLEWIESPPGLPLRFPTTLAIIRNVSRTGFSVLVDRQWFPEQLALLHLPIATATAKVVRARRLGSRCYDIGFRMVLYKTMESA